MNTETQQMLHRIRFALGEVAAKDDNDILANAASALNVRLEGVGTTFGMKLSDLSDVDRQIIRYALAEQEAKKPFALIAA